MVTSDAYPHDEQGEWKTSTYIMNADSKNTVAVSSLAEIDKYWKEQDGYELDVEDLTDEHKVLDKAIPGAMGFAEYWVSSYDSVQAYRDEAARALAKDETIGRSALAGLQLVEASPPTDAASFRGAVFTQEELARFAPGKSVDLSLASFIYSSERALEWSKPTERMEDTDPERDKRVLFELESGAKAAPIGALAQEASPGELLTSGRFMVTSVQLAFPGGNDYTVVKLKQLGTFDLSKLKVEGQEVTAPEASVTPKLLEGDAYNSDGEAVQVLTSPADNNAADKAVDKLLSDPQYSSLEIKREPNGVSIYNKEANKKYFVEKDDGTDGYWSGSVLDMSSDNPLDTRKSFSNDDNILGALDILLDEVNKDLRPEPSQDKDATPEEQVGPPPGTETLDGANGLLYSGVVVTDKTGSTGTVVKLNTGTGYAYVQMEDGSKKWRSAGTLSTDGSVAEITKKSPGKSSVGVKKPSNKATGAGVPKVVITAEEGQDWTQSNFDSVPSLSDAIEQVTGGNGNGMKGASAAVDSDSIEDLDVRVMHVRAADGTDGTLLKFKLTDWAGNARVKSLLKQLNDMTVEERAQSGIVKTHLKIDHIEIDPATGIGKLDQSTSPNSPGYKVSYEDTSGRTYTITTPEGITIKIHRANTDGSSSITSYGPRAFHNKVTIHVPTGTSPDAIANALATAGVEDVRPATQQDSKILIENRLMSIFGKQTNASKNPKGEEREAILSHIEQKWGITVDDVSIVPGVDGRIETRISPEAAQKIVEATGNPTAITHNLSPRLKGVKYDHSASDNTAYEEAVADWFVDIITCPQGALLSTTTRWSEGIGGTGMSSHRDVTTGGADYVFTKSSKYPYGLTSGSGQIIPQVYFDPIKMYQRLDFYANYGDKFGKRAGNQDIISAAHHGNYEVMFKHRIGFDSLLHITTTQAQRTRIIEKLRQKGITELGGRPLEEVIITPGMQNS